MVVTHPQEGSNPSHSMLKPVSFDLIDKKRNVKDERTFPPRSTEIAVRKFNAVRDAELSAAPHVRYRSLDTKEKSKERSKDKSRTSNDLH